MEGLNDVSRFMGCTDMNVMSAMLHGMYAIDYGFITKVHNIDIVDVQVGAATSTAEITMFTCVLASMGSRDMMLKTEPQKGDRVIVFYPRTFSPEMFGTEKKSTVVDSNASGYSFGKGIAFLADQYFKSDNFGNSVTVNDKKITVNFTDKTLEIHSCLDADSEEDKGCLSLDDKGNLSYEIKDKCKIEVSDKGELSFEQTGGTKLSVDSKGDFTVETKTMNKVSVSDTTGIMLDAGMKAKIMLTPVGAITIDSLMPLTLVGAQKKSLGALLQQLATDISTMQIAVSGATGSVDPSSAQKISKDASDLAQLLA